MDSIANVVADWPAERAVCRPVPIGQVKVAGFLGKRVDLNLPSILAGLQTPLPRGFEARAAGKKLPPEAHRLAADSDWYKWLEGACYVLARTDDPDLRKAVERVAGQILKCQQPDGYINTQVPPLQRFDTRVNHDLYIAGHFFEAAVARYRVMGQRDLLDAACRWADYIIAQYKAGHSYFKSVGRREHPEYELGFLRLGRAAGRKDYVDFAATLARMSRLGPKVADIKAGGGELHAVRVGYLLAGCADIYMETGCQDLWQHLPGLWEELAETRMYVTGGIGSVGESIDRRPYILPNSRNVKPHRHIGETCACIAMMMFTWRMHAATGEARCFDALERALYNHFLGALALNQMGNFYFNPLYVVGDVSDRSDARHKPMTARCMLPEIHRTTCCMPNTWRFLGALPEYLFSCDDEGVFVNLYTTSTVRHRLPDGRDVHLSLETRYPWDEKVLIRFRGDKPTRFKLRLRIPQWCRQASLALPGQDARSISGGKYWVIEETWDKGHVATLTLPMPVRLELPDPRNTANVGTAAVMRGPLVYCLERPDVDFPVQVARLRLEPEEAAEKVRVEWRKDLLGGVNVLRVPAVAADLPESIDKTKSPPLVATGRDVELTLIPFYARANRGNDSRWVVFMPLEAGRIRPTLAARSWAGASHVWKADTVRALHDQVEPASSADERIPRFTWWDHRGTTEWVQYDFPERLKVSAVAIYWFDDTARGGGCQIPKSWRVLYRSGEDWRPVTYTGPYGVEKDRYNRAKYIPVETDGLRIEVQLAPNRSAGILEWQVQ